MRIARRIALAAIMLAAGCQLPRPPQNAGGHVERCPPVEHPTHSGWLVISFRLPDCRKGFRWTDFRATGPVFAVDSGSQTTILTEKAWHKLLQDGVARQQGRAPIVYIHGYKTDHASALRRTRAIASMLQQSRTVVTLTWPSYSDYSKYFWDQTNNQFVREAAAQQLRAIGSKHPGTELIAHSMGNHILLEAAGEDAKPWFKRLILASPDVDRAQLVKRLARPEGLGVPAIIYASRADQALSAAWRSHGLPRGGDLSRWVTGREMEYVYRDARNTEIVDTSDVRAGASRHAAFIESEAGAADLCRLLNGMPTGGGRTPLGGHHWLLKRVSTPDDCVQPGQTAAGIALKKD